MAHPRPGSRNVVNNGAGDPRHNPVLAHTYRSLPEFIPTPPPSLAQTDVSPAPHSMHAAQARAAELSQLPVLSGPQGDRRAPPQ